VAERSHEPQRRDTFLRVSTYLLICFDEKGDPDYIFFMNPNQTRCCLRLMKGWKVPLSQGWFRAQFIVRGLGIILCWMALFDDGGAGRGEVFLSVSGGGVLTHLGHA